MAMKTLERQPRTKPGTTTAGSEGSPPQPSPKTSQQNQTALGSCKRTGSFSPVTFPSVLNQNSDLGEQIPTPHSVFKLLKLIHVIRVQLLDLGLCRKEKNPIVSAWCNRGEKRAQSPHKLVFALLAHTRTGCKAPRGRGQDSSTSCSSQLPKASAAQGKKKKKSLPIWLMSSLPGVCCRLIWCLNLKGQAAKTVEQLRGRS